MGLNPANLSLLGINERNLLSFNLKTRLCWVHILCDNSRTSCAKKWAHSAFSTEKIVEKN